MELSKFRKKHKKDIEKQITFLELLEKELEKRDKERRNQQ